MKSCTFTSSGLTSSGRPFGRHSLPPLRYGPTSSFFVSTDTTGCPRRWNARTRRSMRRNCASRSGCWRPSSVLRLACRLQPSSCSRRFTVRSLTGCPASRNRSANRAALLHVQRSGSVGSPRVTGSSSRSSASTKPASRAVSVLRPPPGRRCRAAPTGAAPASSSLNPARTVTRDIPVASATRVTPPRRWRAPPPPPTGDACARPAAAPTPRTSLATPPSPPLASNQPWLTA